MLVAGRVHMLTFPLNRVRFEDDPAMSTATFDPETQPGVYINRNTMRALRDKTLALAAEEPNLAWKRAYLSLADAADRVDALYARDGLAGDVTATPGIPRQ